MELHELTSKDNYIHVHGRFSNEEFLIDFNSYSYVLDFVEQTHESIHQLPDDEYIHALKLIDETHGEDCMLRINEMVFE